MKLKLFDIDINLIYLNISNYQYGTVKWSWFYRQFPVKLGLRIFSLHKCINITIL